MQEYKIILTWEAIYDVTDIADYIEEEFGQQRADRFQSDLKEQMQNLGQFSTAFPRTQILYRGYSIHKRSFPPSIIFYIIMEETKEIHILRVLRHERDWENILLQRSTYTIITHIQKIQRLSFTDRFIQKNRNPVPFIHMIPR